MAAAPAPRVAVLPAGRRQARVQLPACLLVVPAAEVVQRREQVAASIGEAVGQGATGVLLTDEQSSGDARVGSLCPTLPRRMLRMTRHGETLRAASGQALTCTCHAICPSACRGRREV